VLKVETYRAMPGFPDDGTNLEAKPRRFPAYKEQGSAGPRAGAPGDQAGRSPRPSEVQP
jgi:hypothetical protein